MTKPSKPQEIRLFIHGTPKSWKRPRFNRKTGAVFTQKQDRSWRDSMWAQAMEHRPKLPFTCPLRVDLEFYFAIPTSWPKWKKDWAATRLAAGRLVAHTGCDRDNLAKSVYDALEGVYWDDDRLIVTGSITKKYAEKPGVLVTIVPLPPLPEVKADLSYPKERKP